MTSPPKFEADRTKEGEFEGKRRKRALIKIVGE
jgi:hypothetical protein